MPSLGDRKYEGIKSDQAVIEMMKLIKGVMFKFDGEKEFTHAMWESYVSVFRCSKNKFKTNQDYFEHFKNATIIISNTTDQSGSTWAL